MVAAVRPLNPYLATELKNYIYLRRNYNGQINARRVYCPVWGEDKITRTKIQLHIDRITKATLPNKLISLVHTYAVSLLHSVTSGTQVLTHAPLDLTLRDLAKTISTVVKSLCLLYPSTYIRKKDEILDPPCVTHPLMKPGTRKMRLQLALKLLFPPCHYPPPTIKVLQSSKIS